MDHLEIPKRNNYAHMQFTEIERQRDMNLDCRRLVVKRRRQSLSNGRLTSLQRLCPCRLHILNVKIIAFRSKESSLMFIFVFKIKFLFDT
jgi:hypothetical protein